VDWSYAAGGLAAVLVAYAAIRRWRSHTRGRDIRITFDWHSHQRDDSKGADDDDAG
jgi:hypothetical protein